MLRRLWCVLCLCVGLSCGPAVVEEAPVPAHEASSLSQELYGSATTLWRQTIIYVCWLDMGSQWGSQRAWVQDQVMRTWGALGGVGFYGWNACPASSTTPAIRIRIADEHPRSYVGDVISNYAGPFDWTMTLNFTFNAWSPYCQTLGVEFCARAIAVHEFGHALGFYHEQDRPDRPSTCNDTVVAQSDGILLGAYDPTSVMNYCNPTWNNDGTLSAGDVAGFRQVYPGHPYASVEIQGCAARTGDTVQVVGTAQDPIDDLAQLAVYISRADGANWTAPCPGAVSGRWCTVNTSSAYGRSGRVDGSWVASSPGDYIAVVNAWDTAGRACTGNRFPVPSGWYDCGTSSQVSFRVLTSEPSSTLSGPSGEYNLAGVSTGSWVYTANFSGNGANLSWGELWVSSSDSTWAHSCPGSVVGNACRLASGGLSGASGSLSVSWRPPAIARKSYTVYTRGYDQNWNSCSGGCCGSAATKAVRVVDAPTSCGAGYKWCSVCCVPMGVNCSDERNNCTGSASTDAYAQEER